MSESTSTKRKASDDVDDDAESIDHSKSKKRRIDSQTENQWTKKCDSVISKMASLTTSLTTTLKSQKPANTPASKESKRCTKLIKSLTADVSDIKKKLQHITDTAHYINKRHLMIESFVMTANNIIGRALIPEGTFYRRCAEFNKSLETLLSDDVYGDPYGSETIFSYRDHDEIKIKDFILKLYTTINKSVEKRFVFGSYRLDHVCEETVTIRNKSVNRYKLIMTDKDTNISIRVYVTKTIRSLESYSIPSASNNRLCVSAILKKFTLNTDLTEDIKKLADTMTRMNRSLIWKRILEALQISVEYLTQREYDCVDIGQNKMIEYSVEKSEPCCITNVAAPYTKVHLECGHELSAPCIYGIVYTRASIDTESILCPICRKNLIPKLIDSFSPDQRDRYEIHSYKITDFATMEDEPKFTFDNRHSNPIPTPEDLYINTLIADTQAVTSTRRGIGPMFSSGIMPGSMMGGNTMWMHPERASLFDMGDRNSASVEIDASQGFRSFSDLLGLNGYDSDD